MNSIFNNIMLQNFSAFKASFENTRKVFWDEKNNKLIHPGEFGAYREELAKKWFRLFVPEKFGISSGFVISSDDSVSTQADLIIYDKTTTPKIENIDNQKFFPIETIVCVGEIKSDIKSIKELNEHLIKLAKFKKIRNSVQNPKPYHIGIGNDYTPIENSFDNIFTFLICNKFDFKLNLQELDYKDTIQRYKHNLVLSLEDGLLCYKTPTNQTKNLPFSYRGLDPMADHFTGKDDQELPVPIRIFLSSIQIALNYTTLLELDTTYYLNEKTVGEIK